MHFIVAKLQTCWSVCMCLYLCAYTMHMRVEPEKWKRKQEKEQCSHLTAVCSISSLSVGSVKRSVYMCVSVLKHKLGFKCGLKAILGVYDFIMAACSQPIIFSLCHCHFSVSQALCWDVTCVIFKYFQIWFIWRVLHRNLRICSST